MMADLVNDPITSFCTKCLGAGGGGNGNGHALPRITNVCIDGVKLQCVDPCAYMDGR